MKGKNQFTSTQINEIKNLLTDLRKSEKNEQKRLRARLRKKYEFNIIDFDQSYSGFTLSDLNSLIGNGTITIIE
jgi:hypothetical protein